MEQFTALKRKALEKYFSRMNDQQRKAVFKIKGPLLILAGAGSGKTTVLVNRIANMIYFGNAYNTEQTYGTPSEQDIKTTLTARQMTLLPSQTLWHMTA